MKRQNKELQSLELEQQKALLILTRGVAEYRATISQYVDMKDTVLEIGFAWGTTTDLLSKHCKHVVGIDKGLSYHTAVDNYPKLELYQIDGFDIRSVIALGYNFDKVYIDVSGCRSMFDMITLIKMYEHTFKPKVIVVKSTRLKRFVAQCMVWEG